MNRTVVRTLLLWWFALPFLVDAFLQQRPALVHRQGSGIPLQATGVTSLEDSNFRTLLNGDKPVLIDTYAPWCGPCKLIEPVIKRCADRHGDSLLVTSFDVESDSNELKIELLLQQVMPKALPTLILVHKGKAIATHKGLISDDELDEFLAENLAIVPEEMKIATLEESSKGSGFISFAPTVDDYMLTDR